MNRRVVVDRLPAGIEASARNLGSSVTYVTERAR
jgi:hypothetical protein